MPRQVSLYSRQLVCACRFFLSWPPHNPACLPPTLVFPSFWRLHRHLLDTIKVLYAQAALIVQSDDGGFVASVSPGANAFRDRAAGDEANFVVGMAATTPSASGGGEVVLSFQGHKVGVRSSPLSTIHAVQEKSCIQGFFASMIQYDFEHSCLCLSLPLASSSLLPQAKFLVGRQHNTRTILRSLSFAVFLRQTVISVVREFTSCAAVSRSRTTGITIAAADDARTGWLQGQVLVLSIARPLA